MFAANFRYSARSLARTPALTFVLLLTVALGVGANAAVFGFMRGSITPPMPLSRPDTIVSVFERDGDGRLGPISYDRYVSLQTRHESLGSLGAARESQGRITVGDPSSSSIVSIAAVTSELADLLDLPLDDGVVISHRLWQSEFDSKAGLRDQQILIDGAGARIASVGPAWLDGLYLGRPIDVWVAAEDSAFQGFSRNSRTFWPIGRLLTSSSLRDVETAINSSNEGDEHLVVILPYTGMSPDLAGDILLIRRLLLAAAGAVFLVACANVAVFFLFRASARSRERSVRIALGASYRDLAQLLICDSILVSLVGGAFAILLAFWTAHIIPVLLLQPDAERLAFAPDITSILVASALCAAVTVACGLLPLLEIRRDRPAAVLQRESAGSSRALRRLRSCLVGAQMAFCCVLVMSAAQLFAGFRAVQRTSVGHRVGEPILVTVQARVAGADLGLEYFRDVERLGVTLPGVSSTAWTAALPGSSAAWYDMRIEPPHLPLREVTLDVATFKPPSPAPFRLEPTAGRMFGGADSLEACRVALVNQEAADELFGGDAVGRRLEHSMEEPVEIIGVVATHRSTSAPSRPTIYYYANQIGEQGRTGRTVFRVPIIADTRGAILTGNIVSPHYFEALGMPLNAGRMLPEHSGIRGCRVAMVNQEAADLYFDGDPVGGAVIDAAGRRTEIVGVVDSSTLSSSQRGAQPALYLPLGQDFQRRMTLILNTRTAPDALVQSARDRLGSIPGGDPSAIVVTTLDQHLKRTAIASERLAAVFVSVCAALALALGVLGLYGAMSDAARHRQRDIALRLALGARHWRIMRQLVGDGVRLAAIGGGAGMLASVFVTRWLDASMSSTATPAVWVWLAAPSILLVAVVIAGVLPMRRATAVNPAGLLQRNKT